MRRRLALHLRWIVLEDLIDRVGDVLVALFWLRLHVDTFLGGHPAPHHLSLSLLGVSHVDHERTDQNVAYLCRRRAARPTTAAPSIAVRAIAAAVSGAEG